MEYYKIYTDIVLIVDRSGSMTSMNNAHIEQIYNLINEQKELSKECDNEIKMSIITFDNIIEEPLLSVSMNHYEVPEIQTFQKMFEPRYTTSIYDAVIKGVSLQKERTDKYISSLHREVRSLNPKVARIVYIITDGYDNTSKSTINDMRMLLEEERKDKYFNTIFLGANIGDVEKKAYDYGLNHSTAMTFTPNYHSATIGMREANYLIRSISSGTQEVSDVGFTQLQRDNTICESYESDKDDKTIVKSDDIQEPPTPRAHIDTQQYDGLGGGAWGGSSYSLSTRV